MDCEICCGRMAYDFSKTFEGFGLGRVDYWRCGDCGFVLSKTHAEMSQDEWERLNAAVHATYQGSQDNPLDPRWKQRIAAQADSLVAFADHGLIPAGRWLDYGCGDGPLSNALAARGGSRLLNYDRYMPPAEGFLRDEDLAPGGFDFVVSTSVFEHLTRREQWDAIEGLVAPRGVFGLHTLVRQEVPCDPDWFYLQPPHTAFFTNAAMARLFEDWGYVSSAYDVEARLWLWFRQDVQATAARIAALNGTRAEPVQFAAGFLDYWK